MSKETFEAIWIRLVWLAAILYGAAFWYYMVKWAIKLLGF